MTSQFPEVPEGIGGPVPVWQTADERQFINLLAIAEQLRLTGVIIGPDASGGQDIYEFEAGKVAAHYGGPPDHECPIETFLNDPITQAYGLGGDMDEWGPLLHCPVCDQWEGANR